MLILRQLSAQIIPFTLFVMNSRLYLADWVNHTCANGASCVDGISSYSCNCSAGFIVGYCNFGKWATEKSSMSLHDQAISISNGAVGSYYRLQFSFRRQWSCQSTYNNGAPGVYVNRITRYSLSWRAGYSGFDFIVKMVVALLPYEPICKISKNANFRDFSKSSHCSTFRCLFKLFVRRKINEI